MNWLQRYIRGFTFIFAGFRYVRATPKLKKWVIAPFVVDLLVLILGGYFGAVYLGPRVTHALMARLGAHAGLHPNSIWAIGISWLLHIAIWFLFLILYLYFIYVSASVIGMPFYKKLSQKTLEQLGISHPHRELGEHVRHSAQMVVTALERAIILVACAGVIFAMSFIPGLNVVATFLGFILVVFDLSDYALEIEGYRLVRRFLFLAQALPEYLGMATFVALTAFVPGLIVLCIPFAIVGATHVVHSRLHP